MKRKYFRLAAVLLALAVLFTGYGQILAEDEAETVENLPREETLYFAGEQ